MRRKVRGWLGLAAVVVSGCASVGPIGSAHFDPSFGRTVEKGEQVVFYAPASLVVDSYMEGEMESHPTYDGVLLLTSERMAFAQWNEGRHYYQPLIWTSYPYIALTKMQNNTLLQYIAMIATDGHKFTYLLSQKSVDQAFRVLQAQIERAAGRTP